MHPITVYVVGGVMSFLLQLSKKYPCHIGLVGLIIFASLEANTDGGRGLFSLSNSSFLSPSLSLGGVPT